MQPPRSITDILICHPCPACGGSGGIGDRSCRSSRDPNTGKLIPGRNPFVPCGSCDGSGWAAKRTTELTPAEADKLRSKLDSTVEDLRSTLQAIQNTALEIIPGYGNTGLSTFTTPVSVMYRLRDEVNTLRAELQSEQQKAIDWFISYQELKTAVADTLEENCHLADGDQCTLKKLKDAYAKAKQAETSLDSQSPT